MSDPKIIVLLHLGSRVGGIFDFDMQCKRNSSFFVRDNRSTDRVEVRRRWIGFHPGKKHRHVWFGGAYIPDCRNSEWEVGIREPCAIPSNRIGTHAQVLNLASGV